MERKGSAGDWRRGTNIKKMNLDYTISKLKVFPLTPSA
jgi:hypothetical protein